MKCIEDDDFRQICSESDNPYYLGDAGKKIANILATTLINQQLIRKQMTLCGKIKDGWFK
jgi:UDP-N-acetylglucosamine 2-epimerase (non-hydrolysing)/GDP/UDP-N,N'-diacetylbacillosamine 2-epimerase (hydrolysing)